MGGWGRSSRESRRFCQTLGSQQEAAPGVGDAAFTDSTPLHTNSPPTLKNSHWSRQEPRSRASREGPGGPHRVRSCCAPGDRRFALRREKGRNKGPAARRSVGDTGTRSLAAPAGREGGPRRAGEPGRPEAPRGALESREGGPTWGKNGTADRTVPAGTAVSWEQVHRSIGHASRGVLGTTTRTAWRVGCWGSQSGTRRAAPRVCSVAGPHRRCSLEPGKPSRVCPN